MRQKKTELTPGFEPWLSFSPSENENLMKEVNNLHDLMTFI
mgnify:CR=1 FL=1